MSVSLRSCTRLRVGPYVDSTDRARDRAQRGAQRYGPKDLSKPIKAELLERNSLSLLHNPQSEAGQRLLRDKYNLPEPLPAISRSCGQRSDLNGKLFSAKSMMSLGRE
jgi:hypothetical protein